MNVVDGFAAIRALIARPEPAGERDRSASFHSQAEMNSGVSRTVTAAYMAPRGATPHIPESVTEWMDEKKADLELLRRTFGIEDNENPPDPVAPDNVGNAPDNRADGEQVEISTEAAALRREELRVEASVEQSDPLVLDLDGNGIDTTGVENGVTFDIDADGAPDRTSFVRGADAFLAYDRNGNGVIDHGGELFGDQNGARNGFEELSKYDANGDGWIDEYDPVYDDLRLLVNDGAGPLRAGIMRTLPDAGVKAISVRYENTSATTPGGDGIRQTGSFIRDDGSAGRAADVLLSRRAVT